MTAAARARRGHRRCANETGAGVVRSGTARLGIAALALSLTLAANGASRPAPADGVALDPATAADALRLELGRRLYRLGLGRDGREIGARIGAGGAVGLRGGAVACANCHGGDGRGGGEGWVRAPDLRWFALGRPRLRDDGSRRPGYDRAALARALRAGVAADGVGLDPAMPRYDLADDELDAVFAHLRALDRGADAAAPPALLVLLPQRDAGPAERLLEGWRNCPGPAAGRRRPALEVLRYRDWPQAVAEVAARERAGRVAALFGPYLIDAEAALAAAPPPAGLPLLLPVSLRGLAPEAATVRFGLPGQLEQARALIAERPRAVRWRLYRDPDDPAAVAQARSLAAELAAQGRAVEETASLLAPETAAGAGPAAVLALSPLPPPGAAAAPTALALPAANLDWDAAQAWRQGGARLRLAHAYPPQAAAAPGRWIGPQQAWQALGCELLAHLPPLPADAAAVPAWRRLVAESPPLRLQGWFELPALAPAASEDGRVTLRDWPDAPAH
ncbi:amino acid/amide ABC transporter substrate-binding protein, HAAT family [Lysobacter sp. yr284]|nr:amino acid/amide ABC transporter substrate-binding protein, HAAT family [Lysobacter sp. yr284]